MASEVHRPAKNHGARHDRPKQGAPPYFVGPGYGNVDGSQGDRPDLRDTSVLGRTIDNPDTSVRLLPKSAFAFIGPNETRGTLGVGTFRRDTNSRDPNWLLVETDEEE